MYTFNVLFIVKFCLTELKHLYNLELNYNPVCSVTNVNRQRVTAVTRRAYLVLGWECFKKRTSVPDLVLGDWERATVRGGSRIHGVETTSSTEGNLKALHQMQMVYGGI